MRLFLCYARVGPDGSPHEMLYEQDEINIKHDPREEANTKAAAEQQTACLLLQVRPPPIPIALPLILCALKFV